MSDPTPSPTPLPAATANIGVQVTLGPNATPVFLAVTVDPTGTHYALVEPVPLGTLTNVITWLNTSILPKLGVTTPIPTTTAGSNWPDPIINLFNTLLTASVDVTVLTVDQPAGTDQPYYTTLQVTGKADPPVSLGLVSIAAAGVMVTSASAATPTSGGG